MPQSALDITAKVTISLQMLTHVRCQADDDPRVPSVSVSLRPLTRLSAHQRPADCQARAPLWPLQCAALSLVHTDHVTWILASDWLQCSVRGPNWA